MKESSAKNALNNLFAVKDVSLAKFIAGFNIENVAESIAQKAVDAGYDTLDEIKNTSINQLSRIDGFAEITAQNLIEGVKERYGEMMDVLNTNKIQIKQKTKGGMFSGLSFCFTGKLDTMKRAEAEQLVADNGGQAKKSVVKGLSYLVTNETAQTAKFQKAQAQGTKIISEKEFAEMIKQ